MSALACLTEKQLEEYREKGFVILRDFLDEDEVESIKTAMSKVIDEWYEKYEKTGEEGPDWEQVVNRDPAVKSGQLKATSRLHSVRKLYRMSFHVDFFRELANHPKV